MKITRIVLMTICFVLVALQGIAATTVTGPALGKNVFFVGNGGGANWTKTITQALAKVPSYDGYIATAWNTTTATLTSTVMLHQPPQSARVEIKPTTATGAGVLKGQIYIVNGTDHNGMIQSEQLYWGDNENPSAKTTNKLFKTLTSIVYSETGSATAAGLTKVSLVVPYEILVTPGCYSEQITLKPGVTLKGLDRDSCIISWPRYETTQYFLEVNDADNFTVSPTSKTVFTSQPTPTRGATTVLIHPWSAPGGSGCSIDISDATGGAIVACHVDGARQGSGYAVGDLLNVTAGTGGQVSVATLNSTGVATVTITTPGTSYSTGDAQAVTAAGSYTFHLDGTDSTSAAIHETLTWTLANHAIQESTLTYKTLTNVTYTEYLTAHDASYTEIYMPPSLNEYVVEMAHNSTLENLTIQSKHASFAIYGTNKEMGSAAIITMKTTQSTTNLGVITETFTTGEQVANNCRIAGCRIYSTAKHLQFALAARSYTTSLAAQPLINMVFENNDVETSEMIVGYDFVNCRIINNRKSNYFNVPNCRPSGIDIGFIDLYSTSSATIDCHDNIISGNSGMTTNYENTSFYVCGFGGYRNYITNNRFTFVLPPVSRESPTHGAYMNIMYLFRPRTCYSSNIGLGNTIISGNEFNFLYNYSTSQDAYLLDYSVSGYNAPSYLANNTFSFQTIGGTPTALPAANRYRIKGHASATGVVILGPNAFNGADGFIDSIGGLTITNESNPGYVIDATAARTIAPIDYGKTLYFTRADVVAVTLPTSAQAVLSPGAWFRCINGGADTTIPTYTAGTADELVAKGYVDAKSVTFATGERISSSVLFVSNGTKWTAINENGACAMTVTP
jgi:hypothetical protein